MSRFARSLTVVVIIGLAFGVGCLGTIFDPSRSSELERARPSTCYDGVKNEGEADVDCGAACVACPGGNRCAAAADCASQQCAGGICAHATCNDGLQNGSEAGLDCGGFCAPCVPEVDLSQTRIRAVPVRRFTRVEYTNVMRSLLGVDDLGESFPADGSTRGFDNAAASLTTDDSHVRAHFSNVEAAVAAALAGPIRGSIVTCGDETELCLREVWTTFGARAWRRPMDPAEVEQLVRAVVDPLVTMAAVHETILASGIQAILMAPEFFFRLETTDVERPLTSHELALRLAMFVWSDLPDRSLLDLANQNRLVEDEVLRSEVRRMLADPRSEGWIQNFAGQLLGMRHLESHTVSPDLFPEFTDELRVSAMREGEAFVRVMLDSARPIEDLVSARWTVLDAALAEHYGVPAPSEDFADFTELPPNRAFGFLGRVGFLTQTSLRDRTSVVRRGNEILSKFLCVALELPDDVMNPLDQPDTRGLSLRERLIQHRAAPECAACHDHIDPLGFAFEHFDAVGKWRDTYEDTGQPVDDSGELVGYGPFEDGAMIAPVVAGDTRFHRCMVRQLMTYGVGHRVGPDDEAWVAEVSRRAQAASHSFGDIAEEVVLSRPFRTIGVER